MATFDDMILHETPDGSPSKTLHLIQPVCDILGGADDAEKAFEKLDFEALEAKDPEDDLVIENVESVPRRSYSCNQPLSMIIESTSPTSELPAVTVNRKSPREGFELLPSKSKPVPQCLELSETNDSHAAFTPRTPKISQILSDSRSKYFQRVL